MLDASQKERGDEIKNESSCGDASSSRIPSQGFLPPCFPAVGRRFVLRSTRRSRRVPLAECGRGYGAGAEAGVPADAQGLTGASLQRKSGRTLRNARARLRIGRPPFPVRLDSGLAKSKITCGHLPPNTLTPFERAAATCPTSLLGSYCGRLCRCPL